MNKLSIGVFDSGIGGLTVLKDLVNKFPNEDFIYLADTKNCPYGVRTKEDLESIVGKIIKYFEKLNVKAIVIACNTATANSYNITSRIPIIRIIEPTASLANKVNKTTAIIATNYTVNSKIYEKYLTCPSIGVPSSEFVEVAEKGLCGTKEAQKIVNDKLLPIKGKVDAAILGCTHFGLLESEIKNTLGDITIIDSSLSISPVLKELLNKMDGNNPSGGSVIFNATKVIDTSCIQWFNVKYQGINIVSID